MTKSEIDCYGKTVRKSVSNYEAKATAAYLIGCAKEVCFTLNIPFEMVEMQSWRSSFLGKEKPGTKSITSKGKTKIVDEDWKDVAMRVCRMMKIEAKSKDAAEAAGVAFWLQTQMKLKRAHANAGPLFKTEDAA